MNTDENGQGLFWGSCREAAVHEVIPGFQYVPNFLSEEHHAEIACFLEGVDEGDWQEIRMRGVVARRKHLCFGLNYVATSRSLTAAPPMPEILIELRNRCAAKTGTPSDAFQQVIVARYPAGAGIGRHVDAPVFGDPVVGVSLLGSARMKFERPDYASMVMSLEPRSLYVISGDARWKWTHTVAPVIELRYAITFRTLQHQNGQAGERSERASQ